MDTSCKAGRDNHRDLTQALPWILHGLGSWIPLTLQHPVMFPYAVQSHEFGDNNSSAEFSCTCLKDLTSHIHDLNSFGNGAKE